MALIVIDAGHGGSKPGAIGSNGTQEKTLTLDVARRVAEILNPSHRAELTRREDVDISLSERARIAKRLMADIFVSVHFNSVDNSPTTQGTETLTYPGAPASHSRLAGAVQASLVAALGYRDRGVKTGNLTVLNPDLHFGSTACCLCEPSFLSNPQEEDRLASADHRQNIANAIADGITDYLDAR